MNKTKIDGTPRFVTGTAGKLFVMQYEPANTVKGSVILAPAFAEEMNKSRRMVSRQARLFANLGYRAVVPDLYGTGDSDGNFGQATADIWRDDLSAMLRTDEQITESPIWAWGHRFGALLVADAVSTSRSRLAGAILWSPCCDGKQFMNQFLRIRSLAGLVSESAKTESLSDIRELLNRGKKIEVAGYEISPELVTAIDQMTIDLLSRAEIPVIHWFEMTSESGRPASPAVKRRVSALRQLGSNINFKAVEGPDFWATPEQSEAPDLLDITTQALV